MAEEGSEGALLAVFFFVGLIAFTILLFRVHRTGFWFSLIFAIEWALLPVAALINATQVRETGCAGAFAAVGATLFLAITVPIGAVGFIVFLLLALFKFRKPRRAEIPH